MYRHQILDLELNFFFSLKNPDFQEAANPSSTPPPIRSVPCSASAASPTIVEQVTLDGTTLKFVNNGAASTL